MTIMAAAGSTKIRARLGRARNRAQASLDRLRGVRRYHYLHIGKTGGTALKAALRAIDHPGTRFLLHQHQVSLGQIHRGEPVFFFVRDPVALFALHGATALLDRFLCAVPEHAAGTDRAHIGHPP